MNANHFSSHSKVVKDSTTPKPEFKVKQVAKGSKVVKDSTTPKPQI